MEAIHRFYYPNLHYTNTETMLTIKNEMLSGLTTPIDSDHRSSLNSRLTFGYQYSQRKRFNQLFACLKLYLTQDTSIPCQLCAIKGRNLKSICTISTTNRTDKTEFVKSLLDKSKVKQIVDLRNKFVHQTGQFSIDELQQMQYLANLMIFVIYFQIFINLCPSDEELCNYLNFLFYQFSYFKSLI